MYSPTALRHPRVYWIVTGVFCAVFVYSAVWSMIDPAGTREQLETLGFPTYLVYPQAIAKLLGVAAILSRRSRTLTDFAFAGFLFDLLLASAAHIEQDDAPGAVLALSGLVVWTAAFYVDRQSRRTEAFWP